MQLGIGIKRDMNAIKRLRLPWWGWLCAFVGMAAMAVLFQHYGKYNLFQPTVAFATALGLAIAVKWNLRRCLWFWGTWTIFAALDIALIVFAPWPINKGPAIQMIGMAIPELLVMFTVLEFVERFMERRTPTGR